jgi:PDDEXK-like domain of unknown function (DUF3799)
MEMTDKVTQLTEGVYEKLDPEIYHAQDSISRGDLVMAEVPAKYRWFKDHPEIEKLTPAKIFGNAFHCKLLEPSVFSTRYCLSRYAEYRSNEAKGWREEQEKAGLTVLSKEQWDALDYMVTNAREHPYFKEVFGRAGARKELSVVTRHPATGLLLRARYDWMPAGNAIPDLKSSMDASPAGFGKQAWNLAYGIQAAHYLDVWNLAHPNERPKSEFIFCVFEKEPPYLAGIYLTPYSLIEYARKIIRARLYTIAHCLKTNQWPGYYDGKPLRECEFELPRWAVAEIEEMER